MLFQQIYKIVQAIPTGKITTYGVIAKAIHLKDARKVGWALHKNPNPQLIPCHRVVNRTGHLASNFVFGGKDIQRLRLVSEGVLFIKLDQVDLTQCLWIPPIPFATEK